MTPHRRCWTPTTMAVYALSIDPTSESRRAVAEITTAAMSSLKTLQFPPPLNLRGDRRTTKDSTTLYQRVGVRSYIYTQTQVRFTEIPQNWVCMFNKSYLHSQTKQYISVVYEIRTT